MKASAILLALALLTAPAAAQIINNPALGTTGVASGGTGATTLALGGILTGNGASAINATPLTGLVLGAGTSVPTAYAGASCTNQFPRSLNASGAATCATVANTDLANSSVTLGATTVALGAAGQVKLSTATVGAGGSQLPACNAGARGTSYIVTDALLPAALATVVGGGVVVVNVTCDGTNWTVM